MVGGDQGGMIWENIIETYTQLEFDVWHKEPKAGALWQPQWIGWGGRREGDQEGKDTGTPMAD